MYFQASKRQTGASGRLHRTVTGEWVWSEEEEEPAPEAPESDEDVSPNAEDKRPMNQLQKADSSGSDNEGGEEVCLNWFWFNKGSRVAKRKELIQRRKNLFPRPISTFLACYLVHTCEKNCLAVPSLRRSLVRRLFFLYTVRNESPIGINY